MDGNAESQPLLTFALPCAGEPETYIRQAIESVIAQTNGSWTLVVVEDTPREPYVRPIVDSYRDSRISYVRNESPHGIGHGWNACLRAATSDLVNIIHADDILEPNYAQCILELARMYPDATLYFTGATTMDAHARTIRRTRDLVKRFIRPSGSEIKLRGWRGIASLCLGNFIFCPAVTYRRALVRPREFSTVYKFVLDLDFYYKTLLLDGSIVGVAQSCFRYRRHNKQMTAMNGRGTACIDEEIERHRKLVGELRNKHYLFATFFAVARPAVRANAAAGALSDFKRGSFHSGAQKLWRAFAV